MTSLMPRHTVSSGCSCAGAALSTASARIKRVVVVREDRLFLGAEVPEEGAAGDPGRGRDLVDGGRLVPLGREQLHRRGRQFAAHLEPLGGGAAACGTFRRVGRGWCT